MIASIIIIILLQISHCTFFPHSQTYGDSVHMFLSGVQDEKKELF